MNPMISGMNMLLEDMIVVLSLRNMFLNVSKRLVMRNHPPSWRRLEFNFNMDSTRDAIVGAVQSATHMAVQYLIFFDIVVKKGIPLT